MSMNISGLGNAYSGVNTNSKQYKALKEKGWLEGVIQNEAMKCYTNVVTVVANKI